MRKRLLSLETMIAIEVSFVVLVLVSIASLQTLKRETAYWRRSTPSRQEAPAPLPAPVIPVSGVAPTAASENAVPVSQLPSSRFMRRLRSSLPDVENIAPSFPLTVKMEQEKGIEEAPQPRALREFSSSTAVIPAAAPHGAANIAIPM